MTFTKIDTLPANVREKKRKKKKSDTFYLRLIQFIIKLTANHFSIQRE